MPQIKRPCSSQIIPVSLPKARPVAVPPEKHTVADATVLILHRNATKRGAPRAEAAPVAEYRSVKNAVDDPAFWAAQGFNASSGRVSLIAPPTKVQTVKIKEILEFAAEAPVMDQFDGFNWSSVEDDASDFGRTVLASRATTADTVVIPRPELYLGGRDPLEFAAGLLGALFGDGAVYDFAKKKVRSKDTD